MIYRLMAIGLMFVMTMVFSPAAAEDIGGGSDSAPAVTAPAAPAAAPVTADAPAAAEGSDAATPTEGADAEGQPIGEGSEGENKPSGFHPLLLVGLVVLAFFMFMNPGKKAEKKRKEMLANLKKNDRVTTIGGIVGTVLEVRENDVTIKVDEGTNAKMKVARWAIRVVGTPEGDTDPEQR